MSGSQFVMTIGRTLEDAAASGPLLVACSGGGDSLALLRACVEQRDAGAPREPIAAHFDHRQRPDSAADGAAVAKWCERWGCRFVRGSFDGGPGASEATLRTARYDWLAAAARKHGAGCVLTGHTADDQAETVLLRVIRGTGVAGLAGIPAVGPLPGCLGDGGDVRVVRPMLVLTGAAARTFLTDRGVAWREDPSNAATAFARNRLRHEILPRLEELNPQASAALGRLAGLAQEEAEATADLADFALRCLVVAVDPRRIVLRDELFTALSPPARTAALRAAWKRGGWPERRMGRREWRRLATLEAGRRIDLPHAVRAERSGERLTLERRLPEPSDSDGPAGR